jgi:hypothetical protein
VYPAFFSSAAAGSRCEAPADMSELEFDLMMAAAEIADYQLSNESIHATAFFTPRQYQFC